MRYLGASATNCSQTWMRLYDRADTSALLKWQLIKT